MGSQGWFIGLALVTVAAFALGLWAGRGAAWRSFTFVVSAITLMALWAWLKNRPDITVQTMPTVLLKHIEGVGATPLFMLILGVAYVRSRVARQRRVVMLGVAIGATYFLQGALWMIQTTPPEAFAQTVADGSVIQSNDYACVPAACATALNSLRVPTTEAEMAELTDTRPGSGATVIRAVDGLRQRLEGTAWRVEVVRVPHDELDRLPLPALAALRFESTRRHMVVVLKSTDWGFLIADPTDGEVWMRRREFASIYDGAAIVFRRALPIGGE